MKVQNLKEFKALIKACQSLGVTAIEVDGIKVNISAMPVKRSNHRAIDETAFPEASIKVPQYDGPITEPEAIPDAGLTEDQMLYYSAQGHDQVEQ